MNSAAETATTLPWRSSHWQIFWDLSVPWGMPFISVHVRKLVSSCCRAGIGLGNWWWLYAKKRGLANQVGPCLRHCWL